MIDRRALLLSSGLLTKYILPTKIDIPRYGSIQVVAQTLDELRSLPSHHIEEGYSAIVAGGLSPADGLGGIFVWAPLITTLDDGQTIIASKDGQPGRWRRVAESQGVQGTEGKRGPRGEPGGNVTAIGLFTDAATLTIPAGADVVRVSGHQKTGVGAFELMADDAVDAAYVDAHPRSSFISANGRGFRYSPSNSRVDITHFGAIADYYSDGTDNTPAIKEAALIGTLLNRPIYVPGAHDYYGVTDTIDAVSGIVGDGKQQSTIAVLESARTHFSSFLDKFLHIPVVRIGRKFSERNPVTYNASNVPVRDFRVIGLALRTPNRSSDPSMVGFYGCGVVYDEDFVGTVQGVSIEACFYGHVPNGPNGHIEWRDCDAPNCWISTWFQCAGGADWTFKNSPMGGSLFANWGAPGDSSQSSFGGGFCGITRINCHQGFAPIVFYQPAGDCSGGMLGNVGIRSSAEQVGNCWYSGGGNADRFEPRRASGNIDLNGETMIWTDPGGDLKSYHAYTIRNDPKFPERMPTYLSSIDAGPVRILNGSLARGKVTPNGTNEIVTGPAVVVWNGGSTFRTDDPGGVRFQGPNGYPYRDRLIGPWATWTGVKDVAQINVAVGGEHSVAIFTIPDTADGSIKARLDYRVQVNNTGNKGQYMKSLIVVNDADRYHTRSVLELPDRYMPPGISNYDYSAIISDIGTTSLSGVHTVELRVKIVTSDPVVLTPGQISITTLQTGDFINAHPS